MYLILGSLWCVISRIHAVLEGDAIRNVCLCVVSVLILDVDHWDMHAHMLLLFSCSLACTTVQIIFEYLIAGFSPPSSWHLSLFSPCSGVLVVSRGPCLKYVVVHICPVYLPLLSASHNWHLCMVRGREREGERKREGERERRREREGGERERESPVVINRWNSDHGNEQLISASNWYTVNVYQISGWIHQKWHLLSTYLSMAFTMQLTTVSSPKYVTAGVENEIRYSTFKSNPVIGFCC